MKVQVRTALGSFLSVDGELVAPGLAVTPTIFYDKVEDDGWDLTHIPSGYKLGDTELLKNKLYDRAMMLARLGNWNEPFRDATDAAKAGINITKAKRVLYGLEPEAKSP